MATFDCPIYTNCKYYVCPYCGRRFLYYENWREFRYCYACGGSIG